jgi:hypothetical protein
MPAAVTLAAAIVLGQRGLPGEPKLAVVDGEAGGHRDQGQGGAAGKEQAEHGRAGSGSRAGWACSHGFSPTIMTRRSRAMHKTPSLLANVVRRARPSINRA